MAALLKCLPLIFALAFAQPQRPAAPTRIPPAQARSSRIDGRFIVKFNDRALNGRTAEQAAAAALGGSSRWTRSRSHSSAGMSSYLILETTAASAALLRAHPDVEFLEQDSFVYTAAVNVKPIEGGKPERRLRGRRLSSRSAWNSANDRADQRSAPVDGAFSYTTDGSGVDIYVLDSGINAAHDEFDTRVVTSLAANFDTTSTDTPAWADCNGHGTFVASQAAGNFVGVASGARIIPVRVFNCAGQATLASLVSAVDYMIGTAGNQTGRKAVINFSGGGGASTTMDSLAARAWAAGMLWVDAAGNEAVSACTKSPARAGPGLTVGAVDASDAWAPFSNFGPCVNISAVGVQNIGAWPSDSGAYAQGDGTSFAAPIVSGVAATIWSGMPAGSTAAQAAQVLLGAATAGSISGLPVGTTNLLAYNGGEAGDVYPSPSGTPPPTPSPATASATASVSVPPSVTSSCTPSLSGSLTRTATSTLTPSRSATRSRTPSRAPPSPSISPSSSRKPTPTRSPGGTV